MPDRLQDSCLTARGESLPLRHEPDEVPAIALIQAEKGFDEDDSEGDRGSRGAPEPELHGERQRVTMEQAPEQKGDAEQVNEVDGKARHLENGEHEQR